MKPVEMSQGRKLAYAALFLAMAMVSTAVFKLVPMGNLSFLRFSLTPSLIIFSSLFLGPFYGAAIGFLSDLIPAFLVPTGEWNFLISIVYLLLGGLPWCFAFFFRRFPRWNNPYFFLALVVLSMAGFYGYVIYEGGLESFFGSESYIVTPIVVALVALLNVGGALFAFFRLKKDKRKMSILLTASLVDLLVGTILKAAAFSLFLSLLASSPFPLPFSFVLAMLLMGLPVNVLIDYFFVNVYVSSSMKLGLMKAEAD